MAYIVRDDLNFDEQRLAELTDSPATQDVADEAVIQRAIDDATGWVDGHLEGRYVLPLNPVPRIVAVWCASAARYFLYRRRDSLQVPEVIIDDYRTAEKSLALVMGGQINLPCPRVDAETGPTASGGALEDVPRKFGRGRDGL